MSLPVRVRVHGHQVRVEVVRVVEGHQGLEVARELGERRQNLDVPCARRIQSTGGQNAEQDHLILVRSILFSGIPYPRHCGY